MSSRAGAPTIGLLTALIAVAACVDSTGPRFPRIEEVEFAASLGIDLSQMSRINGGVYIADLVVGPGLEVRADTRLVSDFDLFLSDGQLIESVADSLFNTGCRQVLPGFEAGVWGMRSGGERIIIVPPDLAYGSRPPILSPIPPGSILVYRVTVNRLRRIGECSDNGLVPPES